MACTCLVIGAALILSGCGTKELLLAKSPSVPDGIDLSGGWELMDDFDAVTSQIARAARQTDSIDERRELRRMASVVQEERQSGSRTKGGIVQVFLENGRALKVTQTGTAMFISFDRSVVEEYRYGQVRMIRVGGAVAQRASGWEDGQFVVETLDDERMKLTERYRLLEGGAQMRREIVFRSRNMNEVTIVVTYAKQPET